MPTDVRVVLVTAPSEDKAAEMARTLVDERLVACVNIVPAVRSIYRWEGAVVDDREVLMVMKTARARVSDLELRVRALHPYTVPEIITLVVDEGSAPYVRFVLDETASEPPSST